MLQTSEILEIAKCTHTTHCRPCQAHAPVHDPCRRHHAPCVVIASDLLHQEKKNNSAILCCSVHSLSCASVSKPHTSSSPPSSRLTNASLPRTRRRWLALSQASQRLVAVSFLSPACIIECHLANERAQQSERAMNQMRSKSSARDVIASSLNSSLCCVIALRRFHSFSKPSTIYILSRVTILLQKNKHRPFALYKLQHKVHNTQKYNNERF